MDPALFEYLVSTLDERQTTVLPAFTTASTLYSPPSSQRRKSKFRYGPRDSLNSRLKIGRPGSRRYRHWENEYFLLKNLSETESESEYSDEDDAYSPSFGLFSAVFEEQNKEVWEPFIDTTEEQQAILLDLSDDDKCQAFEETFQPLSAAEAFSLLRKRSQHTLHRHRDSLLLEQMDNILFAFSNGRCHKDHLEFLRPSIDGEVLVFAFEKKFHRHLLHSVCEFYDLVSYSVDSTEERVTIVHQRQNASRSSSLFQFLNEEVNIQFSR